MPSQAVLQPSSDWQKLHQSRPPDQVTNPITLTSGWLHSNRTSYFITQVFSREQMPLASCLCHTLLYTDLELIIAFATTPCCQCILHMVSTPGQCVGNNGTKYRKTITDHLTFLVHGPLVQGYTLWARNQPQPLWVFWLNHFWLQTSLSSCVVLCLTPAE